MERQQVKTLLKQKKSMARSRASSPARRPSNITPGVPTLVNPKTGKKIRRTGQKREELCAQFMLGGLTKADCAGSKAAKAKKAAAAKKSRK